MAQNITALTSEEGWDNYRLRVPANVPAREFWSATMYSLQTSSFFLN